MIAEGIMNKTSRDRPSCDSLHIEIYIFVLCVTGVVGFQQWLALATSPVALAGRFLNALTIAVVQIGYSGSSCDAIFRIVRVVVCSVEGNVANRCSPSIVVQLVLPEASVMDARS